MKITRNSRGDTYIWLQKPRNARIVQTTELSDAVMVDFDEDDLPVGIEILGEKKFKVELLGD